MSDESAPAPEDELTPLELEGLDALGVSVEPGWAEELWESAEPGSVTEERQDLLERQLERMRERLIVLEGGEFERQVRIERLEMALMSFKLVIKQIWGDEK
jgi:hypothetical protein